MSLTDLLFDPDEQLEEQLHEQLVYAEARSWTRAEVQARAVGLAEGLSELRLEPGQPVGVMLPNGVDPIAALFGTWRAGGVYVPLNPRLTVGEVDHILTSVGPAVIVTTPEHAARLSGTGFDGSLVLAGPQRWTTVPGPVTARDGHDRRHDPDVALIQFTSGTTGPPKPVLLLHSGVLTLLDGVLAKLRGSSSSSPSRSSRMPNLIPVSLSLWAGIYNVLFALRVGSPVVVMNGFDPAEFADLVRRFGVRSTVLPPAAMTMLADDETITDLAPLRFVRSISAPLSPLQAHRFKDRFGIAVLNSYGQTEIGGEIIGWNAADSREHGEDKLGSVGRPHAGVELRTAGGELEGELCVRTPALSAGYADGVDLGDRLTPDGWFRTGDFARIDAEGFVWIEGRVSSMINRGGLKVFPGEVEEVLRLAPAVADVALVGVPDERLGEVPWAFVVPRDPGRLEPGKLDSVELERICREHLAPYKVPVRFVPVAELPRNEAGKVLAADLVERARILAAEEVSG
jgi:long-chain acyl-CoA synthetase